MLGNCDNEKMLLLISSTTNEWPQNHNHIIDDQKALMMNNMASSSCSTATTTTNSSNNRVMEKPGQEQLQQQQALKCPRCDSSNTKFCYYNNYSLSQPRHFCKACKRYWTRGGTLRNVPVGGGCRKNKRVKRPPSSSASATADHHSSSSSANSAISNPALVSVQPQIDLSSATISPLFYGLSNNPSDHLSLPFSRFMSSSTSAGYDHHLQHALGLTTTFSSSSGINGTATSDYDHHTGLIMSNNPTKHIQDIVSSNNNSLLSSYASIFGTSTSTTTPSSVTTSTPSIASLLASKFSAGAINGHGLKDDDGRGSNIIINHFQPLTTPFEDLHIASNGEGGGMSSMNKQVKLEVDHGQGRGLVDWNNIQNNQTDQIGLSPSDPSLYWNNPTAVGANWHDPANLGSSVPSLI